MMPPGGWALPAPVGEADGPGVLGLARVLLLGGLLPLGDDVTHLVGGSFKRRREMRRRRQAASRMARQ